MLGNDNMKLSVATYRASAERLTNIRQVTYGTAGFLTRRGSSLDGAEVKLSRKLGPTNSDPQGTFGYRDGECVNESDCEDDCFENRKGSPDFTIPPVSSLAMMVDGSPRRVHVSHGSSREQEPPPQGGPGRTGGRDHITAGQKGQDGKDQKETDKVEMSHQDSSSTCSKTASTQSPLSSRSRWVKLRTTVQLSGAITHGHKRHPLKREDSFLKRFSTRQIPESSTGSHGHNFGPGEIPRGADGERSWYLLFFTVINPDENALFVWLWILTGCILYNAWALVARQTFPELQTSISSLWYAADAFTDIVFLLDIMVQLRTGYLEQGLMVCDAKKLAGHYLRSRSFLMDVTSLTPLDFIQLQVGSMPLLRFPRFIKMYRSYRFYYIVESRTIYPNMWRVVNLIHILLLLAHWFGCFYYMLSEFEDYPDNGKGWAYPPPVGEYARLPRKYLASVYWSTLTLTTIGDLATPLTNLQYSFTIISYLIGVFVFATIVGQVGNVITNRNASRLEFERLLDGAKLYMRHHRVPRNMQRRVQRWYDYSWSRGRMQGGGDINSALGSLPDKLKTELALHVNLKTLKKVTIFQECQPEFLHDLVLKMKAYIFTPGDLICRKGEVAREMFIIADGILEVISETGKVLTQMKAGDFFGEIGILNLDGFNRRTADVRSVGYAELFSLSREDVLSAMKDYPEAQEILQTMGRKRLMEARLAAAAAKKQDDTSSMSTPTTLRANSTAEPSRESSGKESRIKLKIKQDVKNLHKLLKRHSTAAESKRNRNLGTQLEMATLADKTEDPDAKESVPADEVGNRFHKLISRINSKGGSNTSPTFKGLIQKIPCIGSEVPAPEPHLSGSVSSRSRLLSFTDSTASSGSCPPRRPIGEGLPLLERIKLLRQIEMAKNAPESLINPLRISEALPNQKTVSPTTTGSSPFQTKNAETRKTSGFGIIGDAPQPRKTSGFGINGDAPQQTRKTSAFGITGDQNNVCNNTKLPSSSAENTDSPMDQSLPLLKRVLMLKNKDDSKLPSDRTRSVVPNRDSSTQDQNKTDENSRTLPLRKDTETVEAARLARPSTLDTSSGHGVHQISTSGSSLQSSSLDSSGHASVICAATELWKVPTLEGYAARRARFVRMAAFEENQLDESDTSCASTSSEISRRHKGCQTDEKVETSDEVPGSKDDDDQGKLQEKVKRVDGNLSEQEDEDEKREAPQRRKKTKNSRNSRRSSSTEIVLEKYFSRVMKCMKHVLKTYLEETQVNLHRKIQELQNEVNHKSALIGELEEALKTQEFRASSGLEEISSLSSNLNSDTESENFEVPMMQSESCESEDARHDFASFLHSSQSTDNQSSSHRYSWPSGLSLLARRQKSRPNRKPFSLDEDDLLENTELELNPEDLWRIEFPPNSDVRDPLDLSPNSQTALKPSSTVQGTTPCSPNDWEIQMLVEQFNQRVQEKQSKRRHSLGDFLTCKKVIAKSPSLNDSDLSCQQDGSTKSKPFRRKFSLRDDRLLNRWIPHWKQSRTPMGRRRSLPHFPGKSQELKNVTSTTLDFKDDQSLNDNHHTLPKRKLQRRESLTCSLENLNNGFASSKQASPAESLLRARRNTFCASSTTALLTPPDAQAWLDSCASEKPSTSSSTSPLTPSPERFHYPHDEVRVPRHSPSTPDGYKKDAHSFLPTITEDDSARHPSIKLLKTIYSESCSQDQDPVTQEVMPVETMAPVEERVEKVTDAEETPLVISSRESSVVIVIPENEPLLTSP